MEYNLDLVNFIKLIQEPCFYCDIEQTSITKDRFNQSRIDLDKLSSETVVYHNGVDRIDSKRGYVKGNVIPCCKHCNTAKNSLTQNQFRDLVTKIYNNWAKVS